MTKKQVKTEHFILDPSFFTSVKRLSEARQVLDDIFNDELNESEGGVCRRFHERWQTNYQPEDLIDEDGKPKREHYGNLLEI